MFGEIFRKLVGIFFIDYERRERFELTEQTRQDSGVYLQ